MIILSIEWSLTRDDRATVDVFVYARERLVLSTY